MGTEFMHPLDEIKALDRQIDDIRNLSDLRPIFYRLDEIAKKYADDFEVQLSASELKERVIARGTTLRALGQTLQAEHPAIPPAIPPAPPPANANPVANHVAPPDPSGKRPSPWAPVPPSASPYDPAENSAINLAAGPLSGLYQGDPSAPTSLPLGTPLPFHPPLTPPAYAEGAKPTPPIESAAAGNAVPSEAGANASQIPPHFPPPMAPPREEKPFPDPSGTTPLKRALLIGGLAGAVLAALLIAFLVNRSHKRVSTAAAVVPLSVVTAPDGASIRINGQPKCISNCSIAVPPGDYQVTAFLDGFEPALGNLKVTSKQPAELSLTLTPQAQSIRVLTDQQPGKVTLDDRPPFDLQDGQFVFDKVPAGTHKVKITTKAGDASFTVIMADGALPQVQGPVAVKDVAALVVSSLANRARVLTTAPAKLTVNGAAQGSTGPDGTDLTGFHPGATEFAVDDGKNSRTMSETFPPSPALTVFLKSDVTTGTLLVSAGEDDARVFLNGKEYPRKTKKGELRLQTLGSVVVRVAKDGFDVSPPQNADVKRGSETRLTFKLQPIPTVASLQLRGATPGAEVLLDQKPQGTVAEDGSFNLNAVPPGEHIIDVRKDQFVTRRFQRTFVAGQSVSMAGAEVSLLSSLGTIKIVRAPADAALQYRRTDETQAKDLRGDQIELPAGNYIFTARAPGFAAKDERVQVVNGETRALEFALTRVAATTPAAAKVAGISDFEDPNAWTKDGDMWVHKGAGFIPFRSSGSGIYTFTVRSLKGGGLFRAGRIRWAVQYIDSKNYALFELDRKTLVSKVVEAGKTLDRGKYETGLGDKDASYTVQVDVAPGQLMHSVRDGVQWRVLDTWREPGRNFAAGKFGFLLQGNEEIGLTDFKFTPR